MCSDTHHLRSPAQVLDRLFNGFGGRLFNQIRSREGLAYSVSGGWTATPIDHPGLFIATAETAQPAALLAALRGALDDAVAEPPSAAELRRAKQVGCGCWQAHKLLLAGREARSGQSPDPAGEKEASTMAGGHRPPTIIAP